MPNSRSGSSNEDNAIESTGSEGAPGCSQLLVPVKTQENELIESVKAEIGEAREENEGLKRTLERMEKDYQSLQVRFFDILRGEASRRSTDSSSIMTDVKDSSKELSLCLGMCPAELKKDKEKGMKDAEFAGENQELDTKLQLSAEVKTSSPRPSPETRFQEQKDEDETWNPGKIRKIGENGESDSSPQAQAKRARVCVRARCDTPTMNDGCQWRKYGQKIAKGNPCPRAYYRCTVAPACPVRKQVQRCAEDLSILITTYEGTHNHPLSVTATAMASTTAAAASMLLSGSSTSQTSLGAPATFSGFNGLNFSIYDNSRNRQFYLPNAPSPFHPTITIDLTTPQMNHLNTNRTFSSNFLTRPKFPPPNSLSFPPASDQNILPTPWGNYASQQNPYRSYAASNQQVDHRAASSEQSLTETLTKVLTTDPSFQSVIAAAISSMVAGNKTQEASTNNMHKGSLPLLRSPFPFSVADIASKSTLNKDSSS